MQANDKGQVLASNKMAEIYGGDPFNRYNVRAPDFSPEEALVHDCISKLILGKVSMEELMAERPELFSRAFAEEFREKIITPITYKELLEHLPTNDDLALLRDALCGIFKSYFPSVSKAELLATHALGITIGYGKISEIILDTDLEEIMVNGYDCDVFVYHRKFGPCKTNLNFSGRKDLDNLLQKIAGTVEKKFNSENPLLDARLPDGNRANATFSSVTPMGPSLTIRKFSSVPLSIIDLISNGTMSSEVAAFLWTMIDGIGIEPMNIIVTGGSGSGKTTTLNALSAFIRLPERIVSIEDTLELQLGARENWVQMESRPKMGGHEGVTMDDLLKNAMRMRPDRIILGEVRGSEAETLFIAMDTGHNGIMGTMHSNSAKEMLLRLKSEPMNVPDSLIPLLDIVVVQYRAFVKDRGIQRRVISVTEVSSMERQALLNNVFEWDRRSDSIKRTDVPCGVIETLANKVSRTKNEVGQEIAIRRGILEWMLRKGIRSFGDVEKTVQLYYHDPEELLQRVISDSML